MVIKQVNLKQNNGKYGNYSLNNYDLFYSIALFIFLKYKLTKKK
jgi:hypothetical protein